MTRAEIIASIPVEIPDEVVAREVGTAISYVRQIRRHGVSAMRESSRRHGVRYRQRNLVRVRQMQRDWARQKKQRTGLKTYESWETAWEVDMREQDKAFIRHLLQFQEFRDRYLGELRL